MLWRVALRAALAMGLALVAAGVQAAGEPLLRVAPLPARVLVGQPLAVDIEVLVPGWLTAPLELPASVAADGATIRLADGSHNLSERVDGQTYAGVRRRYELLPGRAGDLTVPSIAVTVRWSDGARQATTPLRTLPLSATVALPEGMETLGYHILTPRFEFTQRVDRPLDALKVGDAFSRTLTLRAEGMPAMQLPALVAQPIAGLAAYADAAVLDDVRGERGAPDRVLRRERITYVVQTAGDYELPGIELRWFDTRAQRLRTARVPALRVHAVAARATRPIPPQAAADGASAVSPPLYFGRLTSRQLAWTVGALALALGLGVVMARRGRVWADALRVRRLALLGAERRALAHGLRALLRARTAARQLGAIEAWWVVAAPRQSLHDAGVHAGDAQLAVLMHAVHGPEQGAAPAGPGLSALAAVRLLLTLRRQWRYGSPALPRTARGLPSLW